MKWVALWFLLRAYSKFLHLLTEKCNTPVIFLLWFSYTYLVCCNFTTHINSSILLYTFEKNLRFSWNNFSIWHIPNPTNLFFLCTFIKWSYIGRTASISHPTKFIFLTTETVKMQYNVAIYETWGSDIVCSIETL